VTEQRYREPGASWWPVTWGPGLAAVGLLLEVIAGGRVHLLTWLVLAALAVITAAVPVNARRRLATVRVTPVAVHFGQEALPLADLAEVDGVGAPAGAPVLGGFAAVPSRTHEVPLRLVDGRTVLGWSQDPERLRAVLRERLASPPPGPADAPWDPHRR
jgi:hypothetical protein